MSPVFSTASLKLLGSGSSLPGPLLQNAQLFDYLALHASAKNVRRAKILAKRLAIQSRHISRSLDNSRSGSLPHRHASDLCADALRKANRHSNEDQLSIDYLIGHTASPETLLPPNVAWVAQKLKYEGAYMELRQACTGFANALLVAAGLIGSSTCRSIAIVGSETGSSYFDINDDFLSISQLINFVQMGDGAGAVLLAALDSTCEATISDIFSGQIGTHKKPGFYIKGAGSAAPECPSGLPSFSHDATAVEKNGPELFYRGVEAIESRGYTLTDFDWIIPHQANGRLAEAFEKEFGLDKNRVYVTADRLGNLGSAAIWVSLDQLISSEKLSRGQRVLILGAEASKYLYGGFVYTH